MSKNKVPYHAYKHVNELRAKSDETIKALEAEIRRLSAEVRAFRAALSFCKPGDWGHELFIHDNRARDFLYEYAMHGEKEMDEDEALSVLASVSDRQAAQQEQSDE